MIRATIKISKSLLSVIILFSFIGYKTYSQEDKKNANLVVQYVKMAKENRSFLDIKAQYKEHKIFEPCKNLALNIYNTKSAEDSLGVKIGTVTTNDNGKASFDIPNKYLSLSSSFAVKIEKSKAFEDNQENVSIKNATIEASIEKTDSTYNIKAKLLDENNKPIADEALLVGVKRTFGNLSMGGEDTYSTDEEGNVIVPIDKGLTGINGKLNFQVILKESDTYGTVIANLYSNFGVPIKDKSTFDKRRMWSPPSKTPLFLLIVPNSILIGIWSILTMLIINLFKIYKSKN